MYVCVCVCVWSITFERIINVSNKFTCVSCYNFDTHEPILIIFGKNVTQRVSNEKMLHFPTSPNLCFYITWWKTKPGNCFYSLKCSFANKHKRTKYHLISVHSWDTIHCRSCRQYYLIKYQMLLNVLLKTVLSPSKTVHRPMIEFNTVQLVQTKTLNFIFTELSPR